MGMLGWIKDKKTAIHNEYYNYKANYNIGILVTFIILGLIGLMIWIPIHYKDNNKFWSIGVAFAIVILSSVTLIYNKKYLKNNIMSQQLKVEPMLTKDTKDTEDTDNNSD
jgi:hypothetical protein